ncbi:MAG: PAS domain S-box protein [Chitinophagaceae bacterium]|nr:MAG: PAS domain S-box protein [Chitinophagaceae bacterium]
MRLPVDIRTHNSLKRWSGYLLVCTISIAIVVLAGWQFDYSTLRGWGQTLTYTNPLSAVCLFLLSMAFLPYFRKGINQHVPAFTSIHAGIVLFIGVVDLIGYATGMDAGLDLMLYRDKLMENGATPFRMTASTAFCFILVSLSIILLPIKPNSRYKPSHLLLVPILLVSVFCLMAYLYKGESFEGFLHFIPMALPTAASFCLLSLAILFLTPGEGFMKDITSQLRGSSTARLLLPAAIIVPALLGLVRIWGVRHGFFTYEFGVAFLTVATIVVFFLVIWYNTITLNRRDMATQAADRALRDSEEQVHAIFTNAPDAIVIIDRQGNIIRWNPESEHLFGWKSSEAVGNTLSDTLIAPEQREAHRRGLNRFLSNRAEDMIGRSIEILAVRKDQKPIDVAMSVSPVTLNGQQYFISFMRNISEKKRTESKLKTFNEELSSQVLEKTREMTDLFERLTDGFIAMDKDFRYIYINRRAARMIQRDPKELIGKNVWEVFPDAVNTATYNAFLQAMDTQEYVMNTDHFEPLEIWQENHIYPSPNGISVFIRDISKEKAAENSVTEANAMADKLIDSLPGVFYFYDEQGKFIKWNKQFEEVTGYSGAEIAGMHPLQFFAQKDHAYMISRIQSVFTNGEGDAESGFLTKSGQFIPYVFKATKINFQGKPCLLGTGIDVKERKKAEAALLASEQKYKLLFESNPMPMWMVKLPEYKLIDVNYTALRKYRYTKAEFLAMETSDLMTDDERARTGDIKINTEFRGEYHAGIWKHQNKQGKVIYADIVTHDIYYQNVPVRLVLSNDVTEQYLAKEQLEKSYESIRELTEYLQNIREEERLHISREIHDELGQQLTVLKMDVSWLNKKIDAADGPVKQKLTELLGLIDTTVKTVRRIASELRPTLLDDLGIQAAVEWHLEEFAKRSGIETSFDPPDGDIEVPDKAKIGLFRIFQESLTNVARHSGAKKVYVSLKESDNNVILTVRDNGYGFDEEKTRKKTLGLLGMKERSTVMGGDYSITSAPGEGTTVKVSVPISLEKEKA